MKQIHFHIPITTFFIDAVTGKCLATAGLTVLPKREPGPTTEFLVIHGQAYAVGKTLHNPDGAIAVVVLIPAPMTGTDLALLDLASTGKLPADC